MNFLFYFQALLLAAVMWLAKCSPVPQTGGREEVTSEGPVFVVPEDAAFPVADQIEEEMNIKTNVIGKMEDLEVTTWISDLSELNFTFPPDMAVSLGLQDFPE